MENLETYKEIVEAAIFTLGVDASVCRTDEPGKWNLHRGQAQIFLMLRKSKNHLGEEKDTLIMVSPIISIPQREKSRYKLLDYLLKISHKLILETFSIAVESDGKEVAYLSSTCFISQRSIEEIAAMLDSLSFYAYKFQQELEEEFSSRTQEESQIQPFMLEE